MRKIRIAYEVITPESAEEGDAAERGWEDEEGVEIAPDTYDLEDHDGNKTKAAVALAVEEITKYGGVEPSDYPTCHAGHTWYTTIDPERDYQDGSEKFYSFFLDEFTEEEELEIYRRLTRRHANH
jgi:hypothetical protein